MKLNKNMGVVDRSIRTIIAIAIIAALLLGKITGVLAIILAVVTVIFLLTSTISFCPLYVLFGISTKKDK